MVLNNFQQIIDVFKPSIIYWCVLDTYSNIKWVSISICLDCRDFHASENVRKQVE